MIGATRRSTARAVELWEPLRAVAEATRAGVPAAACRVEAADARRRKAKTPPMASAEQAALLNGVLYGMSLPAPASVGPDVVPYLVPLFAPVRVRSSVRSGSGLEEQALALDVTVDGRPLWELGSLPAVTAGERHTVELARPESRHKSIEHGSLTVSVGVGPGPATILRWSDEDGTARSAEVPSGDPVPDDAPTWMRTVLFDGCLPRPTPRDLSVGFAVTTELADRAMARLLAQFRPLVASHLQRQELRSLETVRFGGQSSSLDDRANDLFECLVHQVRNYVDKARREEGRYVRELFPYVLACFKPAVVRTELGYQARTGHQSLDGCSVRVSEQVGALRRHAAIHHLDDPAAARAHHAVHWVLARRYSRELLQGELTVADLQRMWDAGTLPRGLPIPDLTLWDIAIGHQAEHTSLDAPDGGDPPPAETVEEGTPLVVGGIVHRAPERPDDDDLSLLTAPGRHGFFALTAHVARLVALEDPEAWDDAVRERRAVPHVLQAVFAPFRTRRSSKAHTQVQVFLLRQACTVDGTWPDDAEVIARWERARDAALLVRRDAIA